jgi:hypothetical protein
MDEARTWLAHVRRLADTGEIGAVMVMVGILMDMRAEEITLRSVRDVDDGCTVLWTESKTEAGRAWPTTDVRDSRYGDRRKSGGPGGGHGA